MTTFNLGNATIESVDSLVAGSFQTVHFTYTACHPIDDSGNIKVVFRSVSDFGVPQFNDPAAPNYCTISTTGNCQIIPRWDIRGHVRPWGRTLFLIVLNGFLNQGEKITVVFGDTSKGSPGWQTQTFCEDTFEFKTLVDPIATYRFKELPESPTLGIVPGKPVRGICMAPSQVMTNTAFDYYLKLEDRWGNPTGHPKKNTHPGFSEEGIQTFTATDQNTGLSARSNPVNVIAKPVTYHPYWADFHGQSEETIGSNSIEDYFIFARDFGLLDISAHQGNDFQIADEFWKTINNVTKAFYQPGAFVTFPGFEWSGNTPLGGDRNVYFVSEGGRITRSCTDLLTEKHSDYEDSPTATKLFDNLKQQIGPRAFGFAHVGGRYADLCMHDPEIELAVEVHSAWGTFEWLVDEALRMGYRVGICANSDGHKGRPGSSYPGASDFGSYGGLTCVLAQTLDRESIVASLNARHFYATTGNRCLVDVKLETKDGQIAMIGDIVNTETNSAQLHVKVVGTAPIECVQIRNGLEVVKTLRPFDKADLGNRVKIVWSGAERRGRFRSVRWNGGLQVHGNTILNAVPVNFWNADCPLVKKGNDRLEWQSVTTGGLCGVILTLEKSDAGSFEIKTLQRNIEGEFAATGLEPEEWECPVGIDKKISIYRLPDQSCPEEFTFSLPMTKLRQGDNPIYIRLTQEDGHMAWSSPIFWV